MAGLACRHPLAAVPENGLVATVRGRMMDYGGRLATTGARWMLGQEAGSRLLPLAVIAALARGRALGIVAGLAFTVTSNAMRASFT